MKPELKLPEGFRFSSTPNPTGRGYLWAVLDSRGRVWVKDQRTQKTAHDIIVQLTKSNED